MKQIAVIAANSAANFELRANKVLRNLDKEPRIVFDQSRPLTAYIIYDQNTEKERNGNI